MMISLEQLTQILANGFFNGDVAIAGMCIFGVVMALVFTMFGKKSMLAAFGVMLPLTVMFNTMGVLADALTILLVLIAILGLAITSKKELTQ